MPSRDELSPDSLSELLGLALETASMAAWEWEVHTGRVRQRVSRALDLGYGPGVAPDTVQAWLGHVEPSDRDRAATLVSECLLGHRADFSVRMRVRDVSGTYRWLEVAGRVAERDARESPVRFIGTARDVHHLQTIEDTVRRDAELFNHIPDCIVCTDAQGFIGHWNAGATALYGYSAEEMLGRHIEDRFPVGVFSEAREVYARLAATGELTAEFADQRKDGSLVWVEARFARYGTSSGALGTLCFARDATQRREEQQRLQRDAVILSQLRDIVVCLDLNGRVTYWNDAAERILGWPRAEMLGEHITQRLPVQYRAQMQAGLARLLQGEVPPPGEWPDIRKDGSRVWILWRNEPLRDAEGKPFAITAIGTDVTERRSAEEQRRQLEAQLFHAQKLESLGTMVGGVAHDFNNTLAIVLVYAEIALGHAGLPADVDEALRQIRLAGGRARDLVSRLLTFGRVQKSERQEVELRAMLQDHAKLLRVTLPSGVEVSIDAPEPFRILADESQLHQVLLNLSKNASDAMNGHGALRLSLGREQMDAASTKPELLLPPGAYAFIRLEDEGSGISPELLEHIFEPFFTTKAVGQGTGLGLATASAIVKGWGGAIDVRSAPGFGSCFTVYLPVGGAPSSPPAPQLVPPDGRGQRILVVDDEEAVAILTRTALVALGYSAECVFTPEQFLQRFEEQPQNWQLLIADQTMPRISGVELAERVRALGHLTPVVITSGYTRQLTTGPLQRIANAWLLEKPFDLAELGRIVARALDDASVEAPKGA